MTEPNLREKIYEIIINSIDEGIHIIDSQGNLIMYNSTEEILEGCKATDVLGKHVTEIYKLDKESSLLLKVLESGKPILNYHQEYFTKQGKYVDVICSNIPLYLGNELIGVVAISRDFSNFRLLAENFLDTQEKLTMSRSTDPTNQEDKKQRINFSDILGSNKQFQVCIHWAKAASKTDSSVLIYGETGTGKELIAQSIHNEGNRSKGPFIAINCAAIPENLLEGILFGTVKGAFTGAINRIGLLEQASGGSIFLDEVNSMPLALQAKLLRVLEEKAVRRLGGNEETPIDTRIISSCNAIPSSAIEQGQIRADLFYRLAVVYLAVPPLRERLDDLDILVNSFICSLNIPLGKTITGLHPDVMTAFKNYHWPGNIRQLKHTIECSMNIVSDTEELILSHHIPSYLELFTPVTPTPAKLEISTKAEITRANLTTKSLISQIKEQEKESIVAALLKSKGNVAKAALELGMSRQLLQYHLKKLGLK